LERASGSEKGAGVTNGKLKPVVFRQPRILEVGSKKPILQKKP